MVRSTARTIATTSTSRLTFLDTVHPFQLTGLFEDCLDPIRAFVVDAPPTNSLREIVKHRPWHPRRFAQIAQLPFATDRYDGHFHHLICPALCIHFNTTLSVNTVSNTLEDHTAYIFSTTGRKTTAVRDERRETITQPNSNSRGYRD